MWESLSEIGLTAGGIGALIIAIGTQAPRIAGALERGAEAWREKMQAERIARGTIEKFREELFDRVAKLERDHETCRESLFEANVKISDLEKRLDAQGRQLDAAVAEAKALRLSIEASKHSPRRQPDKPTHIDLFDTKKTGPYHKAKK